MKIHFSDNNKIWPRLNHFVKTLKADGHVVSVSFDIAGGEIPDADIWFVEHHTHPFICSLPNSGEIIPILNSLKEKFLKFKGKLIFYATDDESWCSCRGLDPEILNRVDAWAVFVLHDIGHQCRPLGIENKFVMIPRYTVDYKKYDESIIKKNRIQFIGVLTGAYRMIGKKNWRAECMLKIDKTPRLKSHFIGGIVGNQVLEVAQNEEYNKTFQHVVVPRIPHPENERLVERSTITLCIPGNTIWSYRQPLAMRSKTAVITFQNLQKDPGHWLYDNVFGNEFYYVKEDLSDFESVCDYALTHLKETTERAEAGYELYQKYFSLLPNNTYQDHVWKQVKDNFSSLGVHF